MYLELKCHSVYCEGKKKADYWLEIGSFGRVLQCGYCGVPYFIDCEIEQLIKDINKLVIKLTEANKVKYYPPKPLAKDKQATSKQKTTKQTNSR